MYFCTFPRVSYVPSQLNQAKFELLIESLICGGVPARSIENSNCGQRSRSVILTKNHASLKLCQDRLIDIREIAAVGHSYLQLNKLAVVRYSCCDTETFSASSLFFSARESLRNGPRNSRERNLPVCSSR